MPARPKNTGTWGVNTTIASPWTHPVSSSQTQTLSASHFYLEFCRNSGLVEGLQITSSFSQGLSPVTAAVHKVIYCSCDIINRITIPNQ